MILFAKEVNIYTDLGCKWKLLLNQLQKKTTAKEVRLGKEKNKSPYIKSSDSYKIIKSKIENQTKRNPHMLLTSNYGQKSSANLNNMAP